MEMWGWVLIGVGEDLNAVHPGDDRHGSTSPGAPLSIRGSVSQVQHEPGRILQSLLHPHQEGHRLLTVDDAVIV